MHTHLCIYIHTCTEPASNCQLGPQLLGVDIPQSLPFSWHAPQASFPLYSSVYMCGEYNVCMDNTILARCNFAPLHVGTFESSSVSLVDNAFFLHCFALIMTSDTCEPNGAECNW